MIAKYLLLALAEMEPTQEDRYDLITTIGTRAKSVEIFKACEAARDELVDQEMSNQRKVLLGHFLKPKDGPNRVNKEDGDGVA